MSEFLTSPTKYLIEDSNIALLGSDLEKRVREHAGDEEVAWREAGKVPGVQIWRIEKFSIVEWPQDRHGSFYDGDSYIVLHTYKKTPDTEDLDYDLHFWIGSESTQDEAATAAYKTVELDDRRAVSSRYNAEVDGLYFRSHRFRPEGHSLVRGDAYVLDLGGSVWQLNTQGSAGKEKYKAAEFLQSLVSDRQGASDVTVFDEGTPGVGTFLTELGIDTMLPSQGTQETNPTHPRTLFRLSDASGSIDFEAMDSPSWSSLSSSDAFLLDDSGNSTAPAIYIWIGKEASLSEKRLAVQYAQRYLYQNRERSREHVSVNIVKIKEGHEIPAFLHALGND
ncbi:hypothetical protein NLI96_g2840 [Meripilus lineatus]|uniref:Gelsolin-like domain-containing protein n=1 Tax=Meripilus lineatus TaxID=2056292 RepID=A0AAD5YLH1_9APHY|nr:hypothetical protein NLI96_g2840 [Physisporinus lineatus]